MLTIALIVLALTVLVGAFYLGRQPFRPFRAWAYRLLLLVLLLISTDIIRIVLVPRSL
jgi:hypothetical protein